MADKSKIEWTDATWNPATGCQKVSPGCDHCYAERITIRFKRGPFEDVKFHPDRLDQPSRWKRPRTIFVCSMSDVFNSKLTNPQIAGIFDAMFAAPQHTYQVLTKRPNRVRRWWDWYQRVFGPRHWPENIWLGTSVESALYLSRVDRIADIAPVTFLSAEPLLEPLVGDYDVRLLDYLDGEHGRRRRLDWVIVGGESGPGARPMDPNWARGIRDACMSFDVPFFFKQWGGISPKANGRVLDGRTWDEMPRAGITTNTTELIEA